MAFGNGADLRLSVCYTKREVADEVLFTKMTKQPLNQNR
jgi:hypothetical protein